MGERVYPEARVGDVFGPYTVTKLLPRVRRSDEKVAWRCTCGRIGQSYVFNLRKVKPACIHEHESGAPTKLGMRFPKEAETRKGARRG